MKKGKLFLCLMLCFGHFLWAQQSSEIRPLDSIKVQQVQKQVRITPIRAGLYSAVLPGLGQYYNRKYWKIPVVLGAIGTGAGVALWNERQYQRYRSAFIAQLNGQPHEFSNVPGITKEALGNAQDRVKRQRDYAIGITAVLYLLGVVDAVVDAHLFDLRNDPDLSISPEIIQPANGAATAGVSFNYRF